MIPLLVLYVANVGSNHAIVFLCNDAFTINTTIPMFHPLFVQLHIPKVSVRMWTEVETDALWEKLQLRVNAVAGWR